MHRSDRDSWRVTVDYSSTLLHLALYVRDSCRLTVPAVINLPPPLQGAIVDHSRNNDSEQDLDAGMQWRSWWEQILSIEGARALGTLRPSARSDSPETTIAVHEGLFDWLTVGSLAPWPGLRDAVRRSQSDAERWISQRKRNLIRHDARIGGLGHAPISAIAKRVATRLNIAPHRMRAAIFVLGVVPVDWSALVSPGVLLCSPVTTADGKRMSELIEEALVASLEAKSVDVELQSKHHRALPPSILTEPLVLWSGREASLTCNRVIPYRDGFEIELFAHGTGLGKSGPAPPRDFQRGFGRFEDLQVEITFADGRAQKVEDLTDQDREGSVTISPFLRPESGPNVLWLWVMPPPPRGSVRLEVSWTSKGIERAAVEFPVTIDTTRQS